MENLSPAEQYLQDAHRRLPGVTSAMFGALPARTRHAQYASSYALLTSCVPTAATAQTVLDLACGDGYLLKLLAERRRSPLRLIGVDMSQSELDAASAALPGDVTLLNERAQTLSLGTGSVDVVISHMALMLMRDIEQVLSEIRRVLRPRGRLAAIVGRSFLQGEVREIFMEVFRPIAREHLSHLPFGDRRTSTEDGWIELLGREFQNIEFEDVEIEWAPSPDELWNSLLGTYDIDRMAEAPRERLREALLQRLSRLQQSDGTIRAGWGLRLITAQAA